MTAVTYTLSNLRKTNYMLTEVKLFKQIQSTHIMALKLYLILLHAYRYRYISFPTQYDKKQKGQNSKAKDNH